MLYLICWLAEESNQGNKSGPWNLPAAATTQGKHEVIIQLN